MVHNEEICRLFHGALSVRREADGSYFPLRLMPEQLARYRRYPTCCYPYTAAGIKLKLTTGADQIAFTFHCRKLWNGWLEGNPTIDVFESGVCTHSETILPEDVNHPRRVEYHLRAGGNPAALTIWLPHNAELSLSAFDLGDWRPVEEKTRRFLVLGDSISQGLKGNSAAFGYAALLERFYDAELLNQSVGGDFFDPEALVRLEGYCPTDVLAALGTNDIYWVKDFDVIRERMHAYFAKLCALYPAARITAITPPYTADCGKKPKIDRLFAAVAAEIAACAAEQQERNIQVIDGFTLVPHQARFFSDAAHPNDLGFAQYALNLIQQMNV